MKNRFMFTRVTTRWFNNTFNLGLNTTEELTLDIISRMMLMSNPQAVDRLERLLKELISESNMKQILYNIYRIDDRSNAEIVWLNRDLFLDYLDELLDIDKAKLHIDLILPVMDLLSKTPIVHSAMTIDNNSDIPNLAEVVMPLLSDVTIEDIKNHKKEFLKLARRIVLVMVKDWKIMRKFIKSDEMILTTDKKLIVKFSIKGDDYISI